MNFKERELVTEDLVQDPMCYNLKSGGHGGSDKGKKRSEKTKKKMSKSHIGKTHTKESKKKMSGRNNPMFGKTGDNNHTFGTMWITNGRESQRIPKEQEIPKGWMRGGRVGRTWIIDGRRSRKMPKEEDIPEGWRKGRTETM
jgi:hypothetical protein